MAFSALLFFSTFLLFLGGLAGVFVCVCASMYVHTVSLNFSRGIHTEYVSGGTWMALIHGKTFKGEEGRATGWNTTPPSSKEA